MWNLREFRLGTCTAVWEQEYVCVHAFTPIAKCQRRTNEVFKATSAGEKLHSWKMDQQFLKYHQMNQSTAAGPQGTPEIPDHHL